jgi:hypothetical protein
MIMTAVAGITVTVTIMVMIVVSIWVTVSPIWVTAAIEPYRCAWRIIVRAIIPVPGVVAGPGIIWLVIARAAHRGDDAATQQQA